MEKKLTRGVRFCVGILIAFLLGACSSTSRDNDIAADIAVNTTIKSTNWHDRVFILKEKEVWERRWQQSTNSWVWIEHAALNDSISTRGLDDISLGPLLCNSTESICRLFIRIESPRVDQGRKFAEWALYNFDPAETSYQNYSSFNIGNYNAYSTREADCTSSFGVDANWHMYCILDDVEAKISVKVYDIDLTELRTSGRENRNTSKDTQTGIKVQPCIMSQYDVFLTNSFNLFHIDLSMEFAKHKGKNIVDVSDGFSDLCFGMENDGRLFARRYDSNKGWRWDNHGRPMAKRHQKKYGLGSMRRLSADKLVFLYKPSWGHMRLYERWRDGSGSWHWSDHGHPGNEDLIEVGWANGGTIFVRSASGHLYQRHWRSDLSNWVWHDHGIP